MPEKRPHKPDPFPFMIKHRKVIIDVIENNSSLPKAWELLSDKLPQIVEVTKFNTFKGYARILKFVDHELEKRLYKVRQNRSRIEKELGKVREDRDKIQQQLGKVRQELSRKIIPNSLSNLENKSNDIDVPKHVGGWGVQLKGNYYRLYKKIDGKLKWIHIGRNWNLDLAQEKINRFMS